MSQSSPPPRIRNMPVTIYVEGLPFAMCVAEKTSLSAMQLRLNAWSLHPHAIDAVEFTRQTPEGPERHRIPVQVDKVLENRARAVFQNVPPRALTALHCLMHEGREAGAAAPEADSA